MTETTTFCPERLRRCLTAEADAFLQQKARPASGKSWTVFDLEFAWDRSAHHAYQISEGASAEKGDPRWPYDKVAAVSWLTLSWLPNQSMAVVGPTVVMTAENFDERAMVSALFGALSANPQSTATTWGGEARDHLVLRRAAMEHGLRLPPQLQSTAPFTITKLEFCLAMAGQSTRAHMPELAAALSIPNKPSASKSIGDLVEKGDWGKVKEQVLADVLSTSALALRFLQASGEADWDVPTSTLALSEAAAAALPYSKFVRQTFLPWSQGRHGRDEHGGNVVPLRRPKIEDVARERKQTTEARMT